MSTKLDVESDTILREAMDLQHALEDMEDNDPWPEYPKVHDLLQRNTNLPSHIRWWMGDRGDEAVEEDMRDLGDHMRLAEKYLQLIQGPGVDVNIDLVMTDVRKHLWIAGGHAEDAIRRILNDWSTHN